MNTRSKREVIISIMPKLKVLIILHLAEQITNGSTGFATDKCNRFITFNINIYEFLFGGHVLWLIAMKISSMEIII